MIKIDYKINIKGGLKDDKEALMFDQAIIRALDAMEEKCNEEDGNSIMYTIEGNEQDAE